jgi:hypothetical protein
MGMRRVSAFIATAPKMLNAILRMMQLPNAKLTDDEERAHDVRIGT